MRDLWVSLGLFCLLVMAVVMNSLYVQRGVDELSLAVEELPTVGAADCEERIGELRNTWQDFRAVARFSLCYTELNRMDGLIEELDCHRRTGNENDFENTKIMMLNILREIARLEKITVDGVM